MNPGSIAMLAAMLAGTATAADAPSEVYKPSAAQIALAGQLRMPPQPPGRNAYPLLWSFDYDLAPGQVDAAYQADRKKADAWASQAFKTYERSKDWPSFPYTAASMAKPFPTVTRDEYATLCSSKTPSCLDQVRGHVEAVRAILARHQALLARVRSLATYDTWWNTMPADMMLPMARVQPALQFWTTSSALRTVDGDVAGGLDEACAAATTFRRLRTNANTMIDASLAEAGARRGLHLMAEILASAPATTPIPDSCRRATAAPTLSDVDTRGIAAFEQLFLQRSDHDSGTRGSQYSMVGLHAALSNEATRRAMLDDGSVPAAMETLAKLHAPQDGNEAMPAEIGDSLVASLHQRVGRGADYVASIRMAGLAIWLHEHPSAQPLARRLASAPLGQLAKRVTVGCQGTCLAIAERNEDPWKGQTWPVATPPPAPPG